jgi:[amino-group carrier protein]-gamma-(L-lysyl/L-ornithyl)-L-glutamate aminotransferase
MIDTIKNEDIYSMGLYPKRDIVLVSGKGAEVEDSAGNRYIDCVAGHGVASVGHCNEAVVKAVQQQAGRLITCPGTFYNDSRAHLLEKLINLLPENLNRVYLCNSGTEAIEAAIKFARYSTGKSEFVCAMKGFHGRTMGALSATFNPKYRKEFMPLVPGFSHVPFNNFKRLQEAVTDHTAGIILEPIQGEGGVHIGDIEFFKQVRQLCDQKGILLILDEVQTGFGRTGRMFGFEHFGIEPDLLCLAKAMAGGVPIGAVVCSQKIQVPKGKHGSTFGGNPLACAAAIAAIDYMQENRLHIQAEEKGRYLIEKLQQIDSPIIRDVRGMGLMVGIELKTKVTPYIERLMKDGRVLTLPAGSTVLRLLPPLVITYEQLDIVVNSIKELFI